VKRRSFIAGLGSAAAWPLAARAQQRIPAVGLLSGVSFEDRLYARSVAEILEGLKEVGFVEGQNMLVEYRSADGHPERVQDLANDLVHRQVAVIVAIGGANVALVAKATTSTIPIVFAVGGDALENGLVKNFNKPEANVTGMSFNTRQLAPKRLDFLRALLPKATLFGYLDNVATASEVARQELVASARSAGTELVLLYAGTAHEIDSAFETMVQQRVQGVVVSTDAYLITRQEQIISLAKLHALPVMHSAGSPVRSGGLMSYVFVDDVMSRRAGIYAGRILKGTNVADLPVEMPTKFRLSINLKTAEALGLTVPPSLLAVADEVIE
jgi:putative tryptophan/tyrosine transport system substrate-binding protein